jgi:hypothetical protein
MIDDILDGIFEGEYDDSLDQITDAVQERRRANARKTTRRLNPGDEVRFSGEIRPKYLIGMTATVVKINRQSVVVSCPNDPAYGRFSGSRNVRCPNTLIEGLA